MTRSGVSHCADGAARSTGAAASVRFALLSAGLALSPATWADQVTFFTIDHPPQISLNAAEVATGPAAEMLRRIAELSNFPESRIEIVPWARAVEMTIKRADTCRVADSRSAANETQFKWVGPLYRQRPILFERAESNYTIKRLEDAKGVTVGVLRGAGWVQPLEQAGLIVEEAPFEALNLDKLEHKRIELWATEDVDSAPIVDAQPGDKPKLAWQVAPIDMFIVCSKGVGDDTIQRMNQAVTALIRQGELGFLGWPRTD